MGLPLPLFQIAVFLRRYRCGGPYTIRNDTGGGAAGFGHRGRAAGGGAENTGTKGDETLQTLDSKNAAVDSGDVALDSKNVGDIKGTFTVPAYQRGYRWDKTQVKELLEDIDRSGDKGLCLQPIVVKRRDDGRYELIDGQQRLTTLYLIYLYMKNYKQIDPPFSLEYETRPKSGEYLARLDEKSKDDNVDFYHIYGSYQAIKRWFEEAANQDRTKADTICSKFSSSVFVIWYAVGVETNSSDLFTRLNAGKIPLTNAELIKARLFLSLRDEGKGKSPEWANLKQIEIATQWDAMERELRDEEFWAFLTNAPGDAYPARIELVFDILAKKGQKDKEEFQTFRWFEKRLKNDENDKAGKADRLWNEVQETFQMLRSWYEDRDLYHAIGYLVACGAEGLPSLVAEAKERAKSEFKQKVLEEKIKESLRSNGKDELCLEDLSYKSDTKMIEKILLLFNIKEMKNSLERYPFSRHKKERLSLEHIHAQNAESLSKEKEWGEWLTEHEKALEKIDPNDEEFKEIRNEIQGVLKEKDKVGIHRETFEKLQRDVIQALSDKGGELKLHGLGNLALIPQDVNSTLNNSVFAVKRQKIIELDRDGCYIPIGTRRVFLKYYGDGQNRLHLWSPSDYDAYFKEIEDVLKPYLSKIRPTEEGGQ